VLASANERALTLGHAASQDHGDEFAVDRRAGLRRASSGVLGEELNNGVGDRRGERTVTGRSIARGAAAERVGHGVPVLASLRGRVAREAERNEGEPNDDPSSVLGGRSALSACSSG
jgi:hypothetical protein